MRVYYDREVDVLGIEIIDVARSFDRNEELPYGDVILDLAADGRVLALEISNASKKYPISELTKLNEPPEEVSLAEAAEVAGVSHQSLRKACERGRLEGRKVGKTWIVSMEALNRYLDTRVHQGPKTGTEG